MQISHSDYRSHFTRQNFERNFFLSEITSIHFSLKLDFCMRIESLVGNFLNYSSYGNTDTAARCAYFRTSIIKVGFLPVKAHNKFRKSFCCYSEALRVSLLS